MASSKGAPHSTVLSQGRATSAAPAAATRALADAPSLQALSTTPLVRQDPFGWDALPTILPFVPKGRPAEATAEVFRALSQGAAGRPNMSAGTAPHPAWLTPSHPLPRGARGGALVEGAPTIAA